VTAVKARTVVVVGTLGAVAAGVRRSRGLDRSPLAAPAAGERRTVTTSDGAELVVEVVGPDDAPVVVLPHCWGGDIATWGPVTARLVDGGHRVVRWYQRGHGPSTTGSDGYAIERFGADLAEVLEALDVRDAVAAGHSLGGMTVQSFAVHHPEVLSARVRALVLVATSSGDLSGGPLGAVAPRVLSLRAADTALAGRYGHVWVRGALGRAASPAAVRATHEHFRAMSPEVRNGILASMQVMHLTPHLAKVGVPTTVVVGTRDTLTPVAHARRIAGAVPGAELVVLPGRGHMLPFEATAEVADAIAAHHRR
jgi:non-heme chloroperoxidase